MANLTPKQRKFCEFYAVNGNATESAKLAGYSQKTARQIGEQNLSKVDIQEYIKDLASPIENKRIADAQEIKEFWSNAMRAEAEKMTDRIKASELLAKSGGMFIDRVETKVTTGYQFNVNRAKRRD